ncbi:MAG: putative Ig domain-containing protein [Isosphaeraceae bacterium]|nr:putative Ig domain-containing protein [Isosphaeraceae bacterium]
MSRAIMRHGSVLRRGLRGRRRLEFDRLEARIVLDSRTFAGLEFVAVNAFATKGGTTKVGGPVTLRRVGDPTNLLEIENGVSFAPGDTARFTAIGGVSAVLGNGSTLPLLGGSSEHQIKISDLLGSGARFDSSAAGGITVGFNDLADGRLRVDSIKITATPPVVSLGGSVIVAALGGAAVPLPASVPVVVKPGGAELGVDFQADLASGATFERAGARVEARAISVAYRSVDDRFEFSGDATLTLPGVADPIGIRLGTSGSATAGIVVNAGVIERFSATVTSTTAFRAAGLAISPRSLGVAYAAPGATRPFESVTITGAASFALEGSDRAFELDLGNGSNDRGIEIRDGVFAKVAGAVSVAAPITIARAVTFSQLTASLVYDSDAERYAIGGSARIRIESADRDFTVALGDAESDEPGLIIENGELQRLDASVAAGDAGRFGYRGLAFAPHDMRLVYSRNLDDTGATIAFSGGAAIEFSAGGATQSIDVALGSIDVPGLEVDVPDAGTIALRRLEAEINADFVIRGLAVEVDRLTLEYVDDGGPETYRINGSVAVSATGGGDQFVDVTATLGDGASNDGIVIENGSLESLFIIVQDGFDLHGLSVRADGLTIVYQSDPGLLVFSGGLRVDLGAGLGFGAKLSGAGLTIDVNTGALAIATTGAPLELSGSIDLGGVFAAEVRLVYASTGPDSYRIDASGTIDLPAKLPRIGATFAIDSGTLTAISFELDTSAGPIPLGTTGVLISRMSGSLVNLDDLDALTVIGEAAITTRAQVAGISLLEAEGSFRLTTDGLRIEAQAELLNGWLGSGRAIVDLDWTAGVYQIMVDPLEFAGGAFQFRGSIVFDSIGNLTIDATASLVVPSWIPFIGNTRLASANLYVQVRPELGSDRSFAAAWFDTFMGELGIQYSWDGSIELITDPPTRDTVGSTRFTTDFGGLVDQGRLRSVDVILESVYYQEQFDGERPNGDDAIVYFRRADGSVLAQREFAFFNAFDMQPVPGNPLQRKFRIHPSADLGLSVVQRAEIAMITVGVEHNSVIGRSFKPKVTINRNYDRPAGLLWQTGLDESTGRIRLGSNWTLTAPGYDQAVVSFYATNEIVPDGAPRTGRLLRTIDRSDPADAAFHRIYDPAAGGLAIGYSTGVSSIHTSAHADMVALLDDGSVDPTKPIYIYAVLQDGTNDPLISRYSDPIVGFSPYVEIAAPSSFEVVADALAPGVDGLRFAPDALLVTTHTRWGETQYDIEVTVDRGYLSDRANPGNDGRKLRRFFFGNVSRSGEGPLDRLNGLKFVADDTFEGEAILTISTVHRIDGREFRNSRQIRLRERHADLATTLSVSGSTNDYGEFSITVTAANLASEQGRDARNSKVSVAIPEFLALREWSSSDGSYDPGTGAWSLGRLDPGELQTLTILATFHQPPTPRSDFVTAAIETTTFDLVPGNDRASTRIVADGLPALRLDLFYEARPGYVGDDYESYDGSPLMIDESHPGAGGPYVFSGGVGLPPGMSLARDGALRGTPRVAGIYRFRASVTDRLGNTSSLSYAIGVSDRFVSRDEFTSFDFFVDRGATPTFAFVPNEVSNALPPGLALDAATGIVSGAASVPGFYRILIRERVVVGGVVSEFDHDAYLRVDSTAIPLEISPVFATPRIGEAVAYQLSLPLRESPRYRVVEGVLPPGLVLTPQGRIVGTPTASNYPGSGPVRIHAEDARGARGWILLDLRPSPTPTGGPMLRSGSPVAGVVGKPYEFRIDALANSGAVTVTIPSAFSLPAGLVLTPDGRITGRPTTAGSKTVRFRIRDAAAVGPTLVVDYDFQIAPSFEIEADALPAAVHGLYYDATLGAVGGSGTGYAFAVVGGLLPPGIQVDTSGRIAGTMHAPSGGIWEFVVRATDSLGAATTRNVRIESFSLPIGNTGDAYSQILIPNSVGTNARKTEGRLPPGLSIVAGKLEGTPTAPGSYEFEVAFDRVVEGTTRVFRRSYRMMISENVVLDSAAKVEIRYLRRGESISRRLLASGGIGGPFTFALAPGAALPSGLVLASDGRLRGTPTATGTFSVEILAFDAAGGSGRRSFTISVHEPLRFDGSQVAPFVIGSTSTSRFATTGGAPGSKVTYAITAGRLPEGVALEAATGRLVGKPTAAGSTAVSVVVVNDEGERSESLLFISTREPIRASVRSIPQQQQGGAIDVQLGATGGIGGPYVFASANLPAFLQLTAAGRLTGGPLAPGESRFEVVISDASGNRFTKKYDLAVNALPVAPSVAQSTLVDGSTKFNPLGMTEDPDGHELRIDSFVDPANGRVERVGDEFIYTPRPGFAGEDSYRYLMIDSAGGRTEGVVTIDVRRPNSAPSAADDAARTLTDLALMFDPTANDSDADGDRLELVAVGAASNGRTRIENGRLVYEPNPGFSGVDVVEYTISDGSATSTARASIEVAAMSRVEFASAATTVRENGRIARVVVRRRGNLSQSVTVDYAIDRVGIVGPAATANRDFRNKGKSVVFAPGQTEAEIRFDLIDDAIVEAVESLAVRLRPRDASVELGALGVGRVDIQDNETVKLQRSRFTRNAAGALASVSLTYSGALMRDDAASRDHFELVGSGLDKRFGTADDIRLDFAPTPSADGRTVTLSVLDPSDRVKRGQLVRVLVAPSLRAFNSSPVARTSTQLRI